MAKSKKNLYESEPKERIDWMRNQALIQQAYIDLIRELKRCPTIAEVSGRVNLSIHTIKKHVADMKFEQIKSPMRALTPDVLAAIYNSARKGTSASQKLWCQIMEGWSEEMNIKGFEKDLTINVKVT